VSKEKANQLKKILKDLEPGTRGPGALLHNKDFQKYLVQAVEKCGDNGARVHKYLLENYGHISYRTIHRYIRQLFGTYPVTGRPPKYLQTSKREK
jgi:hypothetical protein